jgi:hypothetical protein
MLRLVSSRPPGRTALSFLFVVASVVVAFVVAARSAQASEGPGFVLPAGARLPLVSQQTIVDVTGPVARVRVTQRWRNDGQTPLNANYAIPASTGAAIHDLTLTIGSRVVRADLNDVDTTRAEGDVLDKLWARHRVQRLAELGDDDERTSAAIIDLGLTHRLLTSQTSFVVVDSDAGGPVASSSIEQPSLLPAGMDAANLAGLIGGVGVGVGVGAGSGGLGLKGIGGTSVGYGTGGGRGALSTKVEATTTLVAPTVLGSIDPQSVRRVVRAHAGQIRACYESALSRTPGIAGKVVVQWVIGSDGRVTKVQIAESSLKSADIEGCLQTKIATWRFPKPTGGGLVVVNHPFVFRPAP